MVTETENQLCFYRKALTAPIARYPDTEMFIREKIAALEAKRKEEEENDTTR